MKEYYSNLPTISSGRDTPIPPDDPLPNTIVEIGKIHFEGNVIPHEWYNHIKLPSGNVDLVGITILAEIVYWYRPMTVIDEETGQQAVLHKKFKGDIFQSAIGYYVSKFGLGEDQVRKALKRLENNGLIVREYRDVVQRGMKMTNVTFVEPVPEKILEITHPSLGTEDAASRPQGAASRPQGAASRPGNKDYYKTTTKTYKTTTTTATSTATETSPDQKNEHSSSWTLAIFAYAHCSYLVSY